MHGFRALITESGWRQYLPLVCCVSGGRTWNVQSRNLHNSAARLLLKSKDVGCVERGSSVVECRTRNRESPGSNPPLLPFQRLGIFVLSIDALVYSAV